MPNPASTSRIRVRAYECDLLAHVNNAVYLQYLQQATWDAPEPSNAAGMMGNVRALAIEYLAPARNGDGLEIATWIVAANGSRVVCGYTITRSTDGARVVNARIEWDCPVSATPKPFHFRSGAGEAPPSSPLRSHAPPRDNGARPFRWRHTVRRYELDATHRVGAAAYFNWLEEATVRASNIAAGRLRKCRLRILWCCSIGTTRNSSNPRRGETKSKSSAV